MAPTQGLCFARAGAGWFNPHVIPGRLRAGIPPVCWDLAEALRKQSFAELDVGE